MPPFWVRTTIAAFCIAALPGCGSICALARTEPGAGAQAGLDFGRWVDSGGDAAAAATWSRKAAAGVTVKEIEEAFASVAAEDNLRPVGEMFLSQELANRSGLPQKFLKVYSYCDPQVARAIVDFSPPMSAFLPCRITVVEQEDGFWIYAMDMDVLLKLGRVMPPELHASVSRVRTTILKMLDRAAAGEF